MAQPFFNSNYGSPLMRVDNSGIEQAGKAYGQMFANLGKTIGSTIEKFREGKEKKEQQQRSEDLFLRLYETNSDNPIFSALSIQSTEEAKAVAKDISKDPKLVADAMKFAQMQMDQQKRDQANELFNRTIAADDRKIADQQREVNFNRFLGQPGKPIVDPSGPDRNSVLRNLRAGKGVTPPARMIPGPSPAEDMLISQEAKNFMRRAVGAGQPMSEALPMAQKLDSQIAAQTPKPPTRSENLAERKFQREVEKEEKEEMERNKPKPPVYQERTLIAIDDALNILNKDSFRLPVAGFLATTASEIGGTDSANLAQAITTIQSSIGFDRLQKMRDDSPTGGALGQVSERELSLLNSSLGSLSQMQDKEQLRTNLERVRMHYDNFIKSINARNSGMSADTVKDGYSALNQLNQSPPASQATNVDPAELEKAVQAKKDLLQRRKLMSSQNEVGILPAN